MKRASVLAAVAVLAVIVCRPPAARSAATPSPVVADTVFGDPTKPIEVRKGQLFLISVAANPSTGYHWKASSSPDASVIVLKGSAYRAVDAGLVGAPGEELFVYEARGAGDTTISLDYVSPGRAATVGKTVHFKVAVAKD